MFSFFFYGFYSINWKWFVDLYFLSLIFQRSLARECAHLPAPRRRHRDAGTAADFLRHAETQSKIRHENVLQFLGASVDRADQLAIVLQPPARQQSLHHLLASPRRLNKLPHPLKWHMARQVAQTVAYLHDKKGVCVGGALHSANLFPEAKVKLSLLDFGFGGPADAMWVFVVFTVIVLLSTDECDERDAKEMTTDYDHKMHTLFSGYPNDLYLNMIETFTRQNKIPLKTHSYILFYFISFHFILFYFILFYFILFYFISFYFILFYFILFY